MGDPVQGSVSSANERQRLDAEHNPAKRSACRLCGRWVGPQGNWTEVAGWKTCGDCLPLIESRLPGRTAVWRDLLDDPEVTRDEADDLSGRYGELCFFVGRWATDEGQDTQWEHVEDLPNKLGAARVVLERSRAQQGWTRSPTATGCSWCGVRLSANGWIGPVNATWPGPHSDGKAYVCKDGCGKFFQGGAGVKDGPRLLAACVGLDRAVMGVDLGLVSFIASKPTDRAGTDEPWEYLGDLRAELRRRFVREHPKHATRAERQSIDIEKMEALMDAAKAPKRLSAIEL